MIKLSELLYKKPVLLFSSKDETSPIVEIIVEKPKIVEAMFPTEFNRGALGSCMAAAEIATKYLLNRGIKNFKIVEGWVSLYPHQTKHEWSSHTWIEFSNGKIFDPTKKQWAVWGFDPNKTDYKKVHKVYTPEDYLNVCTTEPSDWNKFKKDTQIKEISYSKLMKQVLNETMSFRDLYAASDPVRISKSQSDVTPRSLRVSSMNDNEAWMFSYKSSPSTTGQRWQGYVRFLKESVSSTESADDIDCMVNCNCPDFRYRWAYNDAAAGVGEPVPNSWSGNNGQKPQPYNDHGVGACKHILSLGKFLKTNIEPDIPAQVDTLPIQKPKVNPPIVKKQISKSVPKPIQKSLDKVPVPNINNVPKKTPTSDAPDIDDTHNDEDTYSDSRTDLTEGNNLIYNKINDFTNTNPEFEIFYED